MSMVDLLPYIHMSSSWFSSTSQEKLEKEYEDIHLGIDKSNSVYLTLLDH